jgi:hypothetical protein
MMAGILNHLQARMIANVSEVVQQSDIDVMKAHQPIGTDINHQLAALFVAGFLARWNLCETVRSVRSEMPSLLPLRPSRALFSRELQLRSPDAPLTDFVRSWSEHGAAVAAANRRALLQAVDERLAALPPPGRSRAEGCRGLHEKAECVL